MMFVNLFENAFTSDYKRLEVENNSSILEIAKNNNLDLENCLIFVNGSQKTSNYILKENDVCTIRQFPGAATVATVLFASVATLVSVELVKGAVSVISGGKYGGEPLINSFFPKSTDVNVANTQQNASMNLPSINGASNQKALGKAIPFIIGKTLFAPYVINDGYTTISDGDGKDKYGGIQTFHCLYLVGYNDLKIENVSLGSHLISSNSENIENGKLKNDGTYFSEADYSPLIEIQQGSNEVSLIPQKVVQTNYNVELLYIDNESLKAYGFSAKYPHKIEFEVQFPNGLYGYDSDGNQIEKTVDIHIQMSIDGGKTWLKTPFTLSHTTDVSSSDETINRITAKHFYTMRLVGVMSISDYDYANSIENHVVQFKVWKTVVKNSENNNDVDNLVFSAIRTWCYNDKESNSSVGLVAQVPMIEKYRNRTCRLGFEIKADNLTSGTLQELNLIATSKAHIWDGIGWSTTTKATNNPASLALLALTKNARGEYSYKTTVQKNYLISDKLDLESFGRLYELCDKNISWTSSKGISYSVKQFECNGAVLNQTKTLDLVNNILRCCRSFITLRGKKYGIFSDVEQENSVLILSNQNVYSRTNSKDFADIPDGFSINFVNALEDYQEDTIIVVPNGVDETNPDLKLEQLEYPYITNAYHVKKEGLYQLRCRNLRREIWNASIGIDGYLVEVGDKVEIQDDTILVGIGDGAEVKNVILDNSNSGILGIKTDAKFHITDLSQTYGIRFTKIVERNGEQVPRVFVKKVTVRETQDNYYDEFYFIDEISLDDESKIEIDDIIVFGIYGKETTEAICFGKKDNGDNSFELTLIPYDKNVYNDSLTKFDYDSKITKYVSEGSVIGLTEESLNERLQKSNSVFNDKISNLSDTINNITENDIQLNKVPDIPTVSAIATKDSIKITCNVNGEKLNNSIKTFTIILYKGSSDKIGTTLTSEDSEFTYNFNRSIDKYPEASNLLEWTVKAQATNFYNLTSEFSEPVAVDTSNYGTWKFAFASSNISQDVQNRTALLTFTTTKTVADNLPQYGDTKYKVAIKRVGYVINGDTGEETDESIADTQYYAPNLNASAYPSGTVSGNDYSGNENNYKDKSNAYNYVVSDYKYSQTLPLYGQEKYIYESNSMSWVDTGKKIQNTTYLFKITAFNESGFSITISDYVVTALCASMRDIIYAHNYYKEIYVEKLSALNANIGLISQGGFGDFANWTNFWALSDLNKNEAGTNVDVKGGAFRVGDENEYIMVIPPNSTVGGIENTTNNSMVQIKAGNIKLTSTGAEFESGTYIYDDTDSSKRMHLIASGFELQLKENDKWTNVGKITIDKFSNLFISNVTSDNSDLPTIKTVISEDATIYHLEGKSTDQNGTNAENFTFSGTFEETTLINDNHYLLNGKATKAIKAESICLWTNGDILTTDKIINIADGSVSINLVQQWNDKLGVSYFKIKD